MQTATQNPRSMHSQRPPPAVPSTQTRDEIKYFGVVTVGGRQHLVEVMQTARIRCCDHLHETVVAECQFPRCGDLNLWVKAQGEIFRAFSPRSQRALGAPPVYATKFACLSMWRSNFRPRYKLVNGRRIPARHDRPLTRPRR